MKTDDDAFVRVDEILASMDRINVNHGLLYGLINSDSQPHRNPESKWYISPEVIFLNCLCLHLYVLCITIHTGKQFVIEKMVKMNKL